MGDAPQLVHIPLVHGQQEGVDPKMLQAPWLTEARNVRLRKDNRFGSRYGYVFNSSSVGTAVAAGNFGPRCSVYVQDRVNSSTPAKWTAHTEDDTWLTPVAGSSVGTLGVPRREPVVRNVKDPGLVKFCDVAFLNNLHCVVYGPTSTGFGIMIRGGVGGEVLFHKIQSGSMGKVLAIGSLFVVFYNDTASTIAIEVIDSTNLSSVTVITGALATAANRAYDYDIAPYDGTKCLISYESTTSTIRTGFITTAGAFTEIQAWATGVTDTKRLAVGKSGTAGNVVLAYATSATSPIQNGNLTYRVFTTGNVDVVAPASLDASGSVMGYPTVGPAGDATNDYAVCWNNNTLSTAAEPTLNVKMGGLSTKSFNTHHVVAKPFIGPNGSTLLWAVDRAQSILFDNFATYTLFELGSLFTADVGATTKVITREAVCAQLNALPPANYALDTTYDPRRFTVLSVPPDPVAPGPTGSAYAVALPVCPGGLPPSSAVDLVRITSGTYEDRLLPANINGQLLFSGPVVREFDGQSFYESGLSSSPRIPIFTLIGGGALTGTYQYTWIREFVDAAGRRHRSPPAQVNTISPAGQNVQLTTPAPTFTDKRNADGVYPINYKIYRTLAGGTVFYCLNPSGGTGPSTVYTDSAPDVTISANEVLYTQGERGAISGTLPNDEAPPCKYLWAGSDRVIAGGLEDPTRVQWSRSIFPGEPVQWSIDTAFSAYIEEAVTGVAELDGSWIIFSQRSIWVVDGAGPDDNGTGEFSAPRKLPSETGCTSFRSIIGSPLGIFFQGVGNRMYLLPRGGNAPQFIGQPMRDTFANGFIVAAKVLPAENCIAWLCNFANNASSFIVIYDTRANEWMYDYESGAALWGAARRCADVYNGQLVIDGKIFESSSYTDNVDGSTPRSFPNVLTLGDVRPFGPAGWGRCRRIVALGEARTSSSVNVLLAASYDSGVSYDIGVPFLVTGPAGTKKEVEHALKHPRGNSFRPQLTAQPTSSTVGAEGFVFNDITLETFPSPSTPRLGAGDRG